MESIWNENRKRPQFDMLKGDMKTDVLVIGGGITGILCGYMLKQAGINCVVAEAERICGKTTQNTTAKITCQHGLIYDKMIQRFGVDFARLYLQAQNEALAEYRRMSEKIPCDFEECNSFVFSRNHREKIEKETKALQRIGCDARFFEKTPLPFAVAGAVQMAHQAQFHPLKFLFALTKELTIFENTRILEFKPEGVTTQHGKIKAEKIIVATHFPLLNKHGNYFLKMYQHRSYVLALKNAPTVKDMYVDESLQGLSFRSYGDTLLLGGGSHRTGKKGGNWAELLDFAKAHYPEAEEVCRWATQDCMTLDDIPYIGPYSKRTPNLYVATGFHKWGMTSAMTAAMLLRDMVQEKESQYAPIFSPSRSVLRPQLAVNAAESLLGLITPTTPRCPHMGCALKFNPQERSWDCSCHGSRFTEKGALLDNPAEGDLK
ncbi:MAG: FAD-dependent oxidoreductase [Clostridia bacterium]|nr:FAD-dependent oxidoreductase [Clostridia bacterium]